MRRLFWAAMLASLSGCVSIATYEDQLRRCRSVGDRATEMEGRVAQLESELAAKTAETEELTASMDQLKDTHDELVQKLKSEIAAGDVAVETGKEDLTITLGDKVLFRSGQWELQERGRKALDQVAEVLKKVDDRLIQVEGHTDNVPVSGSLKQRFPSNWDLSSARAAAVVRYLEKRGVNADHLALAAYGDRRPLGDNTTVEGRRQNRRVEISLLALPKTEAPAP